MSFLPDTLSQLDAIFLIATSFVTSFITAALGIGGGLTLFAVMAQLLPVGALIPVHGVVQMGSNIGRGYMLRDHVDWSLVGWFSVGTVLGAFVGGQIVVGLPGPLLQTILGCFVIYSVWGPKPGAWVKGRVGLSVAGGVSTLITMFVGATGPIVMAVVGTFGIGRLSHVATVAVMMVVQHLVKIIVFGLLGFAFGPYLAVMAVMIAAGLGGTAIGKHMLHKQSDHGFKRILDIILTLLALRLLWIGLLG